MKLNKLDILRRKILQFLKDNCDTSGNPMSGTAFAKRCGVSQPTITRFLKGNGQQDNLEESTQNKLIRGMGGEEMAEENELNRLKLENAELKGIIKGLRIGIENPQWGITGKTET